ncbi:MAG: NADH-quinone oxidoreductase subunit NuoH [Anaerolineales bacterium]|jgi:NADH-quinone oxidoreductase subunit H
MDFSVIGQWLRDLLLGWGLSPGLTTFILKALGALVLGLITLLWSGIFLTWLDRKLGARFQGRLGPNRVGKFGIFQPVADLVKLLVKEDTTPAGADKVIFNLAPLLAIMAVVGVWGVVPFAPQLIGTDLNVGVLFIVSVGSIGTLAIMMAGWSSNNKYAMLGAFRVAAQLVSYEVPMVLVLLVPTMLAGSMSTTTIVEQQSTWYVLLAPIASLIFFISSLAEVGRAPFDLLEAESEIVSGYNVEYSGMKFGMLFVAEYLHSFTIAALTAMLFLGGWRGPGAEAYPLLGFLYFMIKTSIVYFVVTNLRFAMPRVRIDQLMGLNWKFFTPLSLAVVILAAVADKLAQALGWSRIGVHLAANGLLLLFTLIALGLFARSHRRKLDPIVGRGAAPVTVPD